jgi:hypothetical protein
MILSLHELVQLLLMLLHLLLHLLLLLLHLLLHFLYLLHHLCREGYHLFFLSRHGRYGDLGAKTLV